MGGSSTAVPEQGQLVQLGRTLDLIWEHEVHRSVHDTLGLPRPNDWDPLDLKDDMVDALAQ